MAPGRMVTSSRRAGRVTNKTKLLIYKGTEKVDPLSAEIIVWDNDGSANGESATKHQHVGAKGVESGELLEHHLQAALSSASLLHSRPDANKPSSPQASGSGTGAAASTKGDATATATLAYHIPTPDATGLVDNSKFAKLYQATKYVEPVNFIRFSDTVEESSGGWGGLGYCMDDADVKWLSEFNAKAEGPSGTDGKSNSSASPQTPMKDGHSQPPNSVGRGMRAKGKEKEKHDAPAPLFISEDTFEYIMGVLEKFTEESVPTLHTNLSLLPPFATVEPMFSSPIPASFLPSNEIPRELPELKALTRMARNIYPHWKSRRELRQGKSIFPALNYDETNDNDPYVCFRRRDVRASRKTRRTDNYSIEQFQKLQTELRSAHNLAQMVVQREHEKKALFKADREVWEAKWKLFEIKRRWPSLGMTREEEEIITGRPIAGVAPITIPSLANGHSVLQSSQTNIPKMRKNADRDRDEREKRERAVEAARAAEKGIAMSGRSTAPEALKDRMLALQQKLEEEMAKKKEADAHWDDCTDSSYQPFPLPLSVQSYKNITALDPSYSQRYNDSSDDEEKLSFPSSFRLRRGRGGIVRLDRRQTPSSYRRSAPAASSAVPGDWLFPDNSPAKPARRRPRSIDEVEDEMQVEEESIDEKLKRRKLNEVWRYDADKGGALGVGMGMMQDQDRFIIDDLDTAYIRNRVTLLRDDDVDKLHPDMSVLTQAHAALDAPIELPPTPIFIRPQVVPPNPQLMAAHMQQQQLLQQQAQMEQFQRLQMLAQQQAMAAQQQQQAMAQAQAQGQQLLPPQGPVPMPTQQQQRVPSADGSTNGQSPVVNGHQPMPPPAVPHANGRPQVSKRASQTGQPMGPPAQPRPSLSPTNSLHSNQANGQSPQLVGGVMMPNGKQPYPNGAAPPNAQGQVDAQAQQRILAARAMAMQQQQAAAAAQAQAQAAALPHQVQLDAMNPDQLAELSRLAQQAGFGENLQGFMDARNKAQLLRMAKMAQQQQQQQQVAQQQQQNGQPPQQPPQQQQQQQNGAGTNGNANSTNNANNGSAKPTFSPVLPNGQMQLKLPAHAAARLGAASAQQQSTASPQRA